MNEKEDWEKRSFGMLLDWQKTLEQLKNERNRENILAERGAHRDFFNVMTEAPFEIFPLEKAILILLKSIII